MFEALEDLVEEAVGLTAVAALTLGLGAGEVVEEAEAFGVVGDDFDEAAVGGGRAAMLEGVPGRGTAGRDLDRGAGRGTDPGGRR